MALVIAVAQQKGGAGKTTVACHLAAALATAGDGALAVATLDMDPQQSLSQWAGQRLERIGKEENFQNFPGASYNASRHLRRLKADFDVVILDTPPHSDRIARQAVDWADLVLVPMQLTPFDLWATKPTAEMIGRTGRDPLLLFNRVPPRSKIAQHIRSRLEDLGIPVAETELGSRTLFAATALAGRGVTEAAPSSPAAAEILTLAEEVLAKAA